MIGKGLKIHSQVKKLSSQVRRQPKMIFPRGTLTGKLHRGSCAQVKKILSFTPPQGTKSINDFKFTWLKIPITCKEPRTMHGLQMAEGKIQKQFSLTLGINMCFPRRVPVQHGTCDPTWRDKERPELQPAGFIDINWPWSGNRATGHRRDKTDTGIATSITAVGAWWKRGTCDHFLVPGVHGTQTQVQAMCGLLGEVWLGNGQNISADTTQQMEFSLQSRGIANPKTADQWQVLDFLLRQFYKSP